MKKLIIAEKPSLAMMIKKSIKESFTGNDGYFESPSYVITWAFGHLFGLIDVEQYDSEYDPEGNNYWTMDNLPFYPDKFKFSLKADGEGQKKGGIKKQFNLICSLISRSDISCVINAGDSDREGEIIIRLILANARNTKPVKRLWLPDQTEKTVQEGLANLLDDKDFDNLANEGMARTFIDWLYGINLTRYCTLKGGKLLRVGRVISEIVNAIYERDMEIKNFVPRQYISLVSNEETNGEPIKLTSKNEYKESEILKAKDVCEEYNRAGATVIDSQKKQETINPGKLYSLSKLQGVLGKRHKFGVEETLNIVQELYEAGYVTYPRTNTEYLATAEKDRIKSIISALSPNFPVKFRDSKSIFDDSKIESHSALTPTTKIPEKGSLTNKQQVVYDTIRNRFVAVFCANPCLVDRTTLKIYVAPFEEFTISGDMMTQKGWTEFDEYSKKDKSLPLLSVGDKVNINFKPEHKESKPPAHYTTDSLLNYLKNPFKKEKEEAKENDDEEYTAILTGLEIGTEATRASIISNAITSGYISHKNDSYFIEELGIYYVETLKALNVSMDRTKTIDISKALKSVYRGEKTIGDSINITKNEINRVFENRDIILDTSTADAIGSIGKCPLCGNAVKKNSWGYGCSGFKQGCKFGISSTVAGKKLTESQVKSLLEKGKTGEIKGFTSKAGKKFNAALKLENGKVAFDFNEPPKAADIDAYCPKCKGELKNDKWAWVCADGCGFKINHQIAGKALSEKDVKTLIKDGKTEKLKGFTSKAGKKFDAVLALNEDFTIRFEF